MSTLGEIVGLGCYNGYHDLCKRDVDTCICGCHDARCSECDCPQHQGAHWPPTTCDCPGGYKTYYPGWKEEA